MNDMTSDQREKLLADMRAVVADAEDLLRLSADDASEGARALRERLRSNVARSREKLAELQETAARSLKDASHAADDFVHENPWRSIAIGAGFGLLVGMLIGRR